MPKYHVVIQYRKAPFEGVPDTSNPEFWEGQHQFEIDSDLDLTKPNLPEQAGKDILSQIAKENGYTAASFVKDVNTGRIWLAVSGDEGEAFYNE